MKLEFSYEFSLILVLSGCIGILSYFKSNETWMAVTGFGLVIIGQAFRKKNKIRNTKQISTRGKE